MFRLRLRVRYHHRARGMLALVLLPVVLLATLALNRAHASIPGSPSSASTTFGVRQFYLTRTSHQANQAPTACAEGYHFASIWEIADPSSLKYNTTLGTTSPDSGAGPPTATRSFAEIQLAHGWVRTGYSYSKSEPAGQANCGTWLSNDGFHWGTVAHLPSDWTSGEQDIGVWNAEVRTCNTSGPGVVRAG